MDNRLLNALFRMDCIIVERHDKIDSPSMEYLSRKPSFQLQRGIIPGVMRGGQRDLQCFQANRLACQSVFPNNLLF